MRRIAFLFLLFPFALSAQEESCTVLGVQDLSQFYQELLDAHAELQQTVDSLQNVVENPPCGSIVAFDGRGYETVQIGSQCWFAENLQATTYADGTAIPEVTDSSAWQSLSSGARCYYNNDAINRLEYGRLYNWYAVDDVRGLCPNGWHVPTDEEWTELEGYVASQGFDGTEGGALKSTYGWSTIFGECNGTDDFGFSALSGGFRDGHDGYFYVAGSSGSWWSSSPDGGNAWYRALNGFSPFVVRPNGNPRFGFSVRCLRDAE